MKEYTTFHRHDCAHCIFLGKAKGHDLYYHPNPNLSTLVARFGDDPCDYISGLLVGKKAFIDGDLDNPLAIAFLLAVYKGLVRKPYKKRRRRRKSE